MQTASRSLKLTFAVDLDDPVVIVSYDKFFHTVYKALFKQCNAGLNSQNLLDGPLKLTVSWLALKKGLYKPCESNFPKWHIVGLVVKVCVIHRSITLCTVLFQAGARIQAVWSSRNQTVPIM